MKFDKVENLKRSDISGPTLLDPIKDEKEDVVKVLLELPKSSATGGGAQSTGSMIQTASSSESRNLIQFDMSINEGLAGISREISAKYQIDMDKHGLLLVVNTEHNKKHKRYVTEDDLRNKSIANGSTISVGTSVKRLAKYIINKINASGAKIDNFLFYLKSYADDVVFNREFCKNNGHQVLLDQIMPVKGGSLSSASGGSKQAGVKERAIILHVLLSLIDDQVISYAIVAANNSDFTAFLIEQVESNIPDKKITKLTFNEEQHRDDRELDDQETIVQKSLALLERGMAEGCAVLSDCAQRLIFTAPKIHARLNPTVPSQMQTTALNFTNQVLLRMGEKGEHIEQAQMHKLRTHVLACARAEHDDVDLRGAIGFFQQLLLANNYGESYGTVGTSEHQPLVDQIKKNLELSSWEKLSSSFADAPLAQFHDAPPGILPLKCLHFFTRKYGDRAQNLIINNSESSKNAFLIVPAAKQISAILANELNVTECANLMSTATTTAANGASLSMTSLGTVSTGATYIELILAQDNVLEELFCTIMLSFFSTWQEMKAISTDFKKVTQIVKEQIHEALSSERLESLDKFRRNLAKHDYTKILEKREKRHRENMEEEYNNPQVRIRRNQIKAQVTSKVIEQRTKYIEEATRFHENPNKLPTRFWARYNRNMRLIMYSEEEANLNDFERCKNIKIRDITDIITGKQCPHVAKTKGRKQNFEAKAFTIKTRRNQDFFFVNFVADSIQDMLMWTDAIRCLMMEYDSTASTKSAVSSHFTDDVDALCRLKMRILLTQFRGETNVDIPESFPTLATLEPVPTEWLIETA